MPHDKNGNLIAVGDRVDIPCVVIAINPGDEYYNCTVETTEVMPPTNTKNIITFNTKQVEKVES